ncbi:SDR family NAD(P)-dependent oxidoreductase [Streptomyces sp. NPDC048277]|uniref:SDR family NAD(P)-dependent oxidoreductase n=1 Tax=Streptomyces sp. NPDC048277 TaxID=3155027 RepID=UPI0033C21EA1
MNNAGVGEGGSTVDIPGSNIRHRFEVNVTGPLLLTQGIAKQMVKRGAGRVVWVSSREEPWPTNCRSTTSKSPRSTRGRS